jgi:hypothetical protein
VIYLVDPRWRIWQPQRDDYVTRGIDPPRAPGYGVPGEA